MRFQEVRKQCKEEHLQNGFYKTAYVVAFERLLGNGMHGVRRKDNRCRGVYA